MQVTEMIKHRSGSSKKRIGASVLLLPILGVAFVLRLIDLNASLWGDEVTTYLRACAPAAYCLDNVKTPLQPMLAHFALYLGHNEVALRLPSFVAGMLGVVAIYWVGKLLHGRTAGLFSSLMLATSTYHVHQSQHGRYYALLMLFGLLWLGLLHRCVTEGGARYWLFYTANCFFGLLTHLFAVPFLVAMNLGALGWVLFSRSFPTRRKKFIRGCILIMCTTVGASGLFALHIWQGHPLMTLIDIGESEDTSDQATFSPSSETGKTNSAKHYRLTLSEYLGYLKEFFYFRVPASNFGYLLAFSGLCGLVRVFRKHPALGCIALSTLCVVPLPMFLIDVPHHYTYRYFTIAYPTAILLVTIGVLSMCEGTAWLCFRRKPWKTIQEENNSRREQSLSRVKIATVTLVVFVVAALVPSTARTLVAYYEWNSEKDWKGLAEYMARTMTPSDVVYYVDPDGIGQWRFRTTVRDFYFKQYLKNSEAYLFSLTELSGNLTLDELDKLARRFPCSTIWFYALEGHVRKCEELLDKVGAEKRSFNGILLWVLGEPTVNLIRGGGFESVDASKAKKEAGVDIIGQVEAYAGKQALRIHSTESATLRKVFRVRKAAHDEVYVVRNPSFEVWDAKGPVGWEIDAPSAKFLSTSDNIHSGQRALGLLERNKPLTLVQGIPMGLAPGNVVEVEVFGKASVPEQLGAGLRVGCLAGEQRVVAYHSGDGIWAPITLRVNVPSDAAPNSMVLELFRTPSTRGEVLVDDVSIKVLKTEESLDPTKTYTLSMMLRYDNLRFKDETSNIMMGGGSVLIAYRDPSGVDKWRHLARLYGTKDWHQVAFRLKPGKDIPVGASWLLVAVQLYGTGTIWVDNLQLEAKDHATPFVEGTRLPHDERLAALGLLP